MKKLGSATDPLWYKDAIIYELHVRAFADSNGDGIGDFPGLLSRLDYLQDLGVTCLWLLPFFPSPLRDDGYDIADYVDVNPAYGTLNDFKQFLDAAHQRNMQVMIELVINHTSDQHPWFQAARLAPPGSPAREMYVWSDTTKLYEGVRIIFTDTEKSNWTWDETAQAFYWHRFFSHQPDLNFDNPRVMEEVLKAMRFWLDMGVDALRLDAIPYLIERDGTSCENVPETHVKIKQVRAALDEEYAGRVILAEANMWPADVRPYFGDGDECQMAFHFPLMPRIYMALRQEDRLPITEIMAQTPDIPASCQWGIFLRNHDELTLEMVTDDERDYMNLAYASDARMRINVGIRRRLAPLIDNNRRRIELLNSLLLSFPGTPIMYYGDEIGMGDNIYLGDRNGVRTPMQWSSDRNAGFSNADPARLYFPVIMDSVYGYQVINVEAQLSDQSSLLHWMRNMIALRKLFPVFGRGTQTFLHPDNRRILAYLRDYTREDGHRETVVCVANLSRFAQPVALDLAEFAGMVPIEMLGYVPFPTITAQPYPLTVAPYGFLWFELQQAPDSAGKVSAPASDDHTPREATEQVALDLLTKGWAGLLAGAGRQMLEHRLPAWVAERRWFGARSQTIRSIGIAEWAELPTTPASHPLSAVPASPLGNVLLVLDVAYTQGGNDRYQLPLGFASGETLEHLRQTAPESVLAELDTPTGPAVLFDATASESFRQGMLGLFEAQGSLPVGDAASAALAVAATIVAAHESKPAHELAPASAPLRAIAEAIATRHSIEPGTVAPEFTGHMPGASGSAPPLMAPSTPLPETRGTVSARHSAAFSMPHTLPGRMGSAEQTNTNLIFGDALLMKLFRRLEPGENPDVEIGRFLTEVARFPQIAPLLGEITLRPATGEPTSSEQTTLAMLQPLIANQGDGWQWTLEELARFFASVTGVAAPQSPAVAEPAALGPYREAAQLLGRRTAEMHLALATPTADPAFAAEAFTIEDLAQDGERIAAQIEHSLDALAARLEHLPADGRAQADAVLAERAELLRRALHLSQAGSAAGQRIRIHGDLHLGQMLRTANDFVFLDFEGEPARPLAERRRKQSPLRDVAGMLRSFSYAAASARLSQPEAAGLEAWAALWTESVSESFLAGYREAIASLPGLLPPAVGMQSLLDAYLLEKALYELLYELNHRPDWVAIPLAGILALSRT